jgi:superfamily II DNA or RNA helicase
MIINIKNKIALTDIPRSIKTEVMSRLSFENPAYQDAQKMGRWTGKIPRYLQFFEETDEGLVIPRGFIRELLSLCKEKDARYFLDDGRRTLPEVDFNFKGQLRPFQEKAVRDILARDSGVLSSATGSGKTIVALYAIAQRKQPALVICHTKNLLYQWRERAVQFLDIEEDEIGLIGDGKRVIGPRLTIGIVNSIYKIAGDIKKHFGHLIIDEAHRAPSRIFTEAATAFDSKYMLGLSATPYRRDGLTKLIYWHLGNLVHKVDPESLKANGDILRVTAIIRETDFDTNLDPASQYSAMMSELTQDYDRNILITNDVVKEARGGSGILLILSDRKDHCDTLKMMLQGRGLRPALLTGSVPTVDRERIVQRLNDGQIKVLIATGQLIGEGFDLPELSTLFLTMPISFRGRVTQYLGRILRPAPGKEKAKLYDYADTLVGVLENSAMGRQRIYRGGH